MPNLFNCAFYIFINSLKLVLLIAIESKQSGCEMKELILFFKKFENAISISMDILLSSEVQFNISIMLYVSLTKLPIN